MLETENAIKRFIYFNVFTGFQVAQTNNGWAGIEYFCKLLLR